MHLHFFDRQDRIQKVKSSQFIKFLLFILQVDQDVHVDDDDVCCFVADSVTECHLECWNRESDGKKRCFVSCMSWKSPNSSSGTKFKTFSSTHTIFQHQTLQTAKTKKKKLSILSPWPGCDRVPCAPCAALSCTRTERQYLGGLAIMLPPTRGGWLIGLVVVFSNLIFISNEHPTYCWWFRNPKQPPFGCIKPVANNGINYQPQLVNAGFLNHQQ